MVWKGKKKIIKDKLKFIKNSRIIEDPFPEHSQYEMYSGMLAGMKRKKGLFNGFFSIAKGLVVEPDPISTWKAYRMGYEKAYQEIEEYCE